MSMYNEPPWAQQPSQEWSLLEIKSGVECATYPLHTRKCTVLGRAADMVHIALAHESCSRQHARIAFDSQGIPWLRDLQATHGTTCNKRKLPKEAIGKIESMSTAPGARGVMIYPGDVLQFGASSRIYCVQGPEEFERGAVKARMQQQQQQAATTKKILIEQEQQERDENSAKEKDTGISWGMSMNDDDVGDDQAATSVIDKTLPMELQVPEKHRKAFDRLNALKYKMSNLETEDSRIRRKGELSEGQERQLQRNQEREETLKKSIIELEEELFDKLYPEKAGIAKKRTASSHSAAANADDDADYEFFDRTKKTDTDEIGNGESEATLMDKWKKFHRATKQHEEVSLPKAEEQVSMLTERLEMLEANGDDEAFFAKNDLGLAQEALGKIKKEQQTTEGKMDEIERLLRIVNKKIRWDRSSGYIGEGAPPVPEGKAIPEHPEMPPPPVELPAFERTMPPPTMERTMPPPSMERTMPPPAIERSMPPPSVDQKMPPPIMPPPLAQKRPNGEAKVMGFPVESGGGSMMPPPVMPPPKRKRVVGPCMPPPSTMTVKPAAGVSAPAKTIEGSSKGTLASIATMFHDGAKDPSNAKTNDRKQKKSNNAIDLNEDVWQAPKDQDGSGMTKLNSKFAGRY